MEPENVGDAQNSETLNQSGDSDNNPPFSETGTEATNGAPTENVASVPSEDKINPAWNPVLEKLPKEFHNQVIPTFKEWDTNFSKVQSTFSPYKEFADQRVDPTQLRQALALANALQNNPRGVFDSLNQRFNFIQEMEQGLEDEEDDEEYDDDEEVEYEDDPRFAEMQQQVQQLQQLLEQQEEEKLRASIEQQLAQTWSSLEAKNGSPFSEDDRNEIIQRALLIGDRTNSAPDLNQGYNDYLRAVSRIRNTSANSTAPATIPNGGGVPKAQNVRFDDEDSIAAFLKQHGIGN